MLCVMEMIIVDAFHLGGAAAIDMTLDPHGELRIRNAPLVR